MKKSQKPAATVTATVATTGTSRKGMSYQRLTMEQKMEIIEARKRHGDGAQVAAELGVKTQYVSSVMTGRKADAKVVNRMYNKVRGRKANA
jgi:hypothetical protein